MSGIKKLKKILKPVFRFFKDNFVVTLSYVLFFIMFRVFVGGYAALVVTVTLLIYSTSMVACEYGMLKLNYYERFGTVTRKRLFFYSILIATPIYFVWLLISVIPIPQYEVWLITAFPACFFCFIPLQTLSEHWNRELKKWFWIIQLVAYVFCFAVGQLVCHFAFRF